jgi:predicted amidophosphoribosyltransferase
MTCPKCHEENPASVMFCRRCHMTLRFACPACGHVQAHGATCDRCGVDFQKYVVMLQFRIEGQLKSARERTKSRNAIIRQVLLLPLTGGYSLIKFLKSAFERG